MKWLFALLMGASALHADVVTRGAIDMGSGTTKLEVARVDTNTNRIVESLYTIEEPVSFQKDFLSHPSDGFSAKVTEQAQKTLTKYAKVAARYGADESVAVATAGFRYSPNGNETASKLSKMTGVQVHVISQEEEGRLGFQTIAVKPGYDPATLIAWDSGRGSFQITSKTESYLAQFGLDDVTHQLWIVRGIPYHPEQEISPMTLEEALTIKQWAMGRLGEAPWLDGQAVVSGVGLVKAGAQYTKSNPFTADEVVEAIGRGANSLTDTSRLILLSAVMDHFNIATVAYDEATGSAPGLLTSPSYWSTDRLVVG